MNPSAGMGSITPAQLMNGMGSGMRGGMSGMNMGNMNMNMNMAGLGMNGGGGGAMDRWDDGLRATWCWAGGWANCCDGTRWGDCCWCCC